MHDIFFKSIGILAFCTALFCGERDSWCATATAFTINKTAVRYKKTYIGRQVNVAEIYCRIDANPGDGWKIVTQPKYGTVQIETVMQPLASGNCPGMTFPYQLLYYTWNKHSNVALKDTFNVNWLKFGGVKYVYDINVTVPAVRPIGEITARAGWDPSLSTVGWWKQKLTPPSSDSSFNFGGELVQEVDPGGGTSDTCWFVGSKVPNFTKITGNVWGVYPNNLWAYDSVGYLPEAVRYYRGLGKAPCGSTFIPQKMEIKALPEQTYTQYKSGTIGAQIGVTTVTSSRDGKSQTITWP